MHEIEKHLQPSLLCSKLSLDKTSPPSAREAAMRSMQNKIAPQNFIIHFGNTLETLFEILLKHT